MSINYFFNDNLFLREVAYRIEEQIFFMEFGIRMVDM